MTNNTQLANAHHPGFRFPLNQDKRSLDMPLRMVDTNYSFDLILQDFPNVETLWDAIQNAQTS